MTRVDELRALVESYLGELALTPELGGQAESVRYSIEVGVVCAPNQIAGANAAEIHRMVCEGQLERTVELGRHVIDSASFLVFLRAAPIGRIEHNAITRLERSQFVSRRRRHIHLHIVNSGDSTDMHAAMARAAAVHDVLMIHARDEIGPKAA